MTSTKAPDSANDPSTYFPCRRQGPVGRRRGHSTRRAWAIPPETLVACASRSERLSTIVAVVDCSGAWTTGRGRECLTTCWVLNLFWSSPSLGQDERRKAADLAS